MWQGVARFFFSGLISMFVFDILQIPSACSQIYCGCCAPNCAPLDMGLITAVGCNLKFSHRRQICIY